MFSPSTIGWDSKPAVGDSRNRAHAAVVPHAASAEGLRRELIRSASVPTIKLSLSAQRLKRTRPPQGSSACAASTAAAASERRSDTRPKQLATAAARRRSSSSSSSQLSVLSERDGIPQFRMLKATGANRALERATSRDAIFLARSRSSISYTYSVSSSRVRDMVRVPRQKPQLTLLHGCFGEQ